MKRGLKNQKELDLQKKALQSTEHLDHAEVSAQDLHVLKDSLLLMKSDILNKSHDFKAEQSTSVGVVDEVEAATQENGRSISIHLHERDRQILFQIERALSKIEDKTYGQCESCGVQIGPRRLKARPFTSLCIDCMEEHEGINTLQ